MGTTTNTDRSIDLLYSGILFIWVPAVMQHVSLLNAGNLNCLHFIKHSASSPRDLAHSYGGGYFSHLSTQKLVLHMKRQEAGAGAKSAPHTRSLFISIGVAQDGILLSARNAAACCIMRRESASILFPGETNTFKSVRCSTTRSRCRRQLSAPFRSRRFNKFFLTLSRCSMKIHFMQMLLSLYARLLHTTTC